MLQGSYNSTLAAIKNASWFYFFKIISALNVLVQIQRPLKFDSEKNYAKPKAQFLNSSTENPIDSIKTGN